jgi:tRNA threonylcarbamoyladenosine biosynthesis protein TsaE
MLLSPQELSKLNIQIHPGDRIYFYGDLGAGKTTMIQHIINSLLGIEKAVRSPTYVYYNKYEKNIYHMDLYRLTEYDEFVSIGGEEIFENPETICLVEWPEIISAHYEPTVIIRIEKPETREDVREITIEYRKKTS